MSAAVGRLNGPPIRSHEYTTRGTFAALALGSLVELVKSAVQATFLTFLASIRLCCSAKWNRKAFEEIKTTLGFAFAVPLCVLGILFPKTIDRLIN